MFKISLFYALYTAFLVLLTKFLCTLTENTLLLYSLQIHNNYNMNQPSYEPSAFLAKHGIKPSLQRIAILSYLMSHKTHPTADEIYRALIPDMPTLSRSTVYNTLWLMAETGAIEALGIDRNNARFDYAPISHAHLLCECCGSIIDLPLPTLDFSKFVTDGAIINSVAISYRGICRDCASKQKQTI